MRVLLSLVVAVALGAPSEEDFPSTKKSPNSYEQMQTIIREARMNKAKRRARDRVWEAAQAERKRNAHTTQKNRNRKLAQKERLDKAKAKRRRKTASL